MEESVKKKKPWSGRKKILALFVAILVACLIVFSYFAYYFMLAYPSAFGVLGLLAQEFHRL